MLSSSSWFSDKQIHHYQIQSTTNLSPSRVHYDFFFNNPKQTNSNHINIIFASCHKTRWHFTISFHSLDRLLLSAHYNASTNIYEWKWEHDNWEWKVCIIDDDDSWRFFHTTFLFHFYKCHKVNGGWRKREQACTVATNWHFTKRWWNEI